MGPFRVYEALKDVWGPLGCMGPFREYDAPKGIWGPLGCMRPLTAMSVNKRPFLNVMHLVQQNA